MLVWFWNGSESSAKRLVKNCLFGYNKLRERILGSNIEYDWWFSEFVLSYFRYRGCQISVIVLSDRLWTTIFIRLVLNLHTTYIWPKQIFLQHKMAKTRDFFSDYATWSIKSNPSTCSSLIWASYLKSRGFWAAMPRQPSLYADFLSPK